LEIVNSRTIELLYDNIYYISIDQTNIYASSKLGVTIYNMETNSKNEAPIQNKIEEIEIGKLLIKREYWLELYNNQYNNTFGYLRTSKI